MNNDSETSDMSDAASVTDNVNQDDSMDFTLNSQEMENEDDSRSVHSNDSVVNSFYPRNANSSLRSELRRENVANGYSNVDYLKKGFQNVPNMLKNMHDIDDKGNLKKNKIHLFEIDTVPDLNDLLSLKPEYETTMDSVSKCFKVIPASDLSHMMQPYEGYSFCYVDRCNSMNIPQHIADVLYFHYALLNHIKANGLTNYVIPISELITLKKIRVDSKKVVGLFESVVGQTTTLDDENDGEENGGSTKSCLKRLFNEYDHLSSDHYLEHDPFTIRVAYTGAFFKVGEKVQQELFCMAIITPNRAFDYISFVNDFLSTPPKNPAAKKHWIELDLCYKKIQLFEVNQNCGLDVDSSDYIEDISGKGGVLNVLSMLRLPMRIAWIILNLPHDATPTDIEILGFPKLSFKYDGSMDGYVTYMNTYIQNQVSVYDTMQQNIHMYYKASDAAQAEFPLQNMSSPGGWPRSGLATTQEDGIEYVEFTEFGLFYFPIVMKFRYQKFIDKPTMESFCLNLGQEPESVMKKKRDFVTFDPEAGMASVMPDPMILQSTDRAVPLKILNKYYGPNAKPAEDFKDSKLIKWYEAMRAHVQSQRENGITPDEAMVQIKRHIESCMEQHMCIVRNDGYGSHHLQQCGRIMDEVKNTRLGHEIISENLRHVKRNFMPKGIRHDAYLGASYTMLHEWCNFNTHASLYATNSETALDILLSSLLWHLGSHSHTMTSFFQGCLIIGCMGHLHVVIDKIAYIDWRKPNSSGAGAIQDRLNKYLEALGIELRIMPDENNLIFINPNRNTMAALENECCVIIINTNMSEVKSKPSPAMKDMPLLMLENRGDYELDTLIRFVFPRDAVQRNVALTTIDPDKTNDRIVAQKQQICNPNVAGFCTNQKKPSDHPKSLICVTHVNHPGAPAYYEVNDASGEINDVQCELNDGRATMPKGAELVKLLKFIFFSKIFTSVMVALPHRAGMFPFHINTTTSSFLDWMYMIVQNHLFCVFNAEMIENFGRIKNGYEYRHVGWSVWMRSINCLSRSEKDVFKAGKEAALACTFDALPMTEVIFGCYLYLIDYVLTGALSGLGCVRCAQHFKAVH